jgi:transcription antitermination protein NusB
MKRRIAREKALQSIFQIDMNETSPKDAIDYVLDGEASDDYLEKLVEGVTEHIEEMDSILTKHLEKWTIDRLATVDRNILRVAVYEMIHCKEDVPVNVAINEALEIAKIYGDESSSKFINSVLSKIKQTLEESSSSRG